MRQHNSIDAPFGIKPKLAVQLGFALLLSIFLIDILTPIDYRFVLLYLFPAAIIALNAKSIKVVIVALIVSTIFENYFLFRDNYFPDYFTKIEAINILIRFLSTLLIIWLARSLRRSQLRVNLLANTDSLTGLWNRRWARMMIEQSIAKLQDHKEIFSVAMVDVNDFKKINDIQGHLVGDQVLTHIAHSLMKFSSPEVSFFRLGGDEFLVLAQGKNDMRIAEICQEIKHFVDQKMQALNYPVSLSIGAVTYQETPQSVSEILHQADLAMYQKKQEFKAQQNSLK